MTFYSYSCGGVGHLSRDCVQGSQVLQLLWHRGCFFPLRNSMLVRAKNRRRVTSAAIAHNPRGVLATRVDQKGGSQLVLFVGHGTDLHSHISRDCPGAGAAEES
jgi:hypothetical protein